MRRLSGIKQIWIHHPMGVGLDIDKWLSTTITQAKEEGAKEGREKVLSNINGIVFDDNDEIHQKKTNRQQYEEFEKFTHYQNCHYCSLPLKWMPHYAGKGGWQLDRKDNSLGYSVENCVVCCKHCNLAKGKHFSYEEWREIGDLIRRQRDRQILFQRRNQKGIKGS